MLDDIGRLDRWAQGDRALNVTDAASNLSNGGFFWMHSANWNLATSSGALDHFPMDEQLAFAALYDGITHRQVDIERSADLFEHAGSLVPVAEDAQGRRELRAALASLRTRISSLAANDGYMRRHFDALGVKPDNRDFAADLAGSQCRVQR